MSNELEKMTNKDLAEYCKEEGIEVESKNVSKPTKAEFLAAIKKFEEEQLGLADADEFLKGTLPESEIDESSEDKPKKRKLTRAEKRKIQHTELFPLRRVLITSNMTSQTQTNLQFITWGNGLIGHQTDRVYLGKPWHVREGALRNMKAATITEPIQDEEGNQVKFETKPAYNIQMLDPLSQEEIDKIAKRQTIRDSSIESLI